MDRDRVGWWALLCILSAAFAFHFSMCELSNLPTNPISLDLREQIRAYVRPYFYQNWNFFAPQPPEVSEGLLARARYIDDNKKTQTTPWLDVSDPMFQSVANNRFTSLGLIELMLSNSVTDFLNSAHRDPRTQYTSHGRKYYKQFLPTGISPIDALIMTRTAAATLRIAYPRDRFISIQLALFEAVFPRFTRRFEKDNPRAIGTATMVWQRYPEVTPFVSLEQRRSNP